MRETYTYDQIREALAVTRGISYESRVNVLHYLDNNDWGPTQKKETIMIKILDNRRAVLFVGLLVALAFVLVTLVGTPAQAATRVGVHSLSDSAVIVHTRYCGDVRINPGQELIQRCGVIDSVRSANTRCWINVTNHGNFSGTTVVKLTYWESVRARTYC